MTTEWSRMPETMLRQAALRQAILDAASPVQWIPTDRKQWHCAHGGRFFCVRGEGQSFTLWETGDEGVVLSYAERKAESWNEVNRYVLEAVGELPRSASELLCDAWRELAQARSARIEAKTDDEKLSSALRRVAAIGALYRLGVTYEETMGTR